MTTERPTYGVGEVIYPRQGLPPCRNCGCSSKVHRYTVVSDTTMAPSGCDGEHDETQTSWTACPCRRYEPPEGTVLPPGTRPRPPREETWTNYPADATSILDGRMSPSTRCGRPLCQAPVWWGHTAASDARCPFDIRPDGTRTGTSHWRTCTDPPPRTNGRKKARS